MKWNNNRRQTLTREEEKEEASAPKETYPRGRLYNPIFTKAVAQKEMLFPANRDPLKLAPKNRVLDDAAGERGGTDDNLHIYREFHNEHRYYVLYIYIYIYIE